MFNRKKIKELEEYSLKLYEEVRDREKELFQMMEKFKYQEGTLISQRELINTLKEQLTLEVNRTNSLQLNLLQQNASQIEKTKEVLSDLFEETEESEEEVISEH